MGKKFDLEAMDFDELWLLQEQLTKVLAEKITAEKLELERRLAHLNRAKPIGDAESYRPRRKYPKVLPKYRNPSLPTETWSGRGKQPRWIVTALRSGHKLEDFLIGKNEKAADSKVRGSRRS